MPPNEPSETAMETANAICGSDEGARNIVSAAVVADSKYAPLVKQGARVADVLDEVISALVDQDPEFAQCSFARESLDAFKSVLARATPKGEADE